MFLPLRDINPSRTFPAVTLGLIAANILVFAYQYGLGPSERAFVMAYAATPGYVTGALRVPAWATPPWETLFTHMFLHGG